jgi:hypothetical protein
MSTEVNVGRIVESINVHCKLRALMSYKTRYGRRHKWIPASAEPAPVKTGE